MGDIPDGTAVWLEAVQVRQIPRPPDLASECRGDEQTDMHTSQLMMHVVAPTTPKVYAKSQ